MIGKEQSGKINDLRDHIGDKHSQKSPQDLSILNKTINIFNWARVFLKNTR